MMASSCTAAAALATFLLLLVHSGAMAVNYPVAGTGVWTFGQFQAWANRTSFKQGDTITFNYNRAAHSVVTLHTQADFDNCIVGSPKKTYTSGSDRIALEAGTNFFTCGFPGHCDGMKFSAFAAKPTRAPAPVPKTTSTTTIR